MQKKLTEKQKLILDFVERQVKEKGYPPSVREICSAVGFKSTSTVHSHLAKLEKLGLIEKDPTKPRALKVVKNHEEDFQENRTIYFRNRELLDIPVVGRVTAGQPILAVENIEDTLPLPSDFVQGSASFILKVQGDSMIEAGILDGDLVIVKQQSTAENGDIIVALIGDEATVKTFYKEKDYVRLQPQNRFMDPIIVKDNFSVLGKVIGLIRRI